MYSKHLWSAKTKTYLSVVSRLARLVGLTVIGSSLLAACAASPSPLNPASQVAEQLATLWWVLLTISLVVFVVVMGLLAFALFRRRQGTGAIGNGRLFVTVGGGLVPAVILVGVMIYTVGLQNALSMPDDPAYTVQIIGHQWWWEVHYPDQDITTANEIHVPVDQPVVLKLTSADVIHSLWAPQLQMKMDLLPGQTNTTWIDVAKPGIYRTECAEFCGLQHAHMQLLIVAESTSEMEAWVEAQQRDAVRPAVDEIQQGQQIFLGSACVYCHTIQGTVATGKIGPDLTHIASRETIGAGTLVNNTGNLSGWIINSQTIKPGNEMPPMYLNADELRELVAYLESLQ